VTSLRLRLLAGRDVADRCNHQHPFLGLDRREADLDGKFAAVLAPSGQIQADAHRSRARVGDELVSVRDVALRDTLGEQDLHRLPHQLIVRVSERRLRLRIGVGDPGRRVHRHDGVGRCLEHG
jgi:hypothetical protein